MPEVVDDLPAGARRLVQRTNGIAATVVNGEVLLRNGKPTGALPGKLLRIWTHLGSTQGIFITPKDEMWILTHRNNTENITYDTLAGRLMRIDLETGAVLGSMECPGHQLTVSADGAIYVASLTGNVFKWSRDPNWPTKPAAASRVP